MHADLWPAPVADRPIDAQVVLPGSKSMTNRALVLAALAGEPLRLRQPLHSRDTLLMADALRALGVGVETGDDWRVTPGPLHGPAEVEVGLAGTVMRFVPPLACLADGVVRFDGDARARERPLRPLIEALCHLGADIDDSGRGGMPFTVVGHGNLTGGDVSIDASASSQLLSALLLAAPAFDAGLSVRHVGERMPSAPLVDLTVAMLRDRGARVDATDEHAWRVEPGPLGGGDVLVEPDLSSAAPFLAAALVTGGTVRIPGWPAASLQPGTRTPDVFARMGGTWQLDDECLTMSGSNVARGIDANLGDNSELVCVLTAVAAVADSPSRITGIAHMRGHETDRLAALARELNALGGRVTELDDGLAIEPAPLHAGVFHTYDDHRLAMAGAVIGLVTADVLVENVATVAKTLPNFVSLWESMLAGSAR